MGMINFSVPAFRAQFPQFSTPPSEVSDAALNSYFTLATAYISNRSGGAYCGGMNALQQMQALYLMTAHLAAINLLASSGQLPGILTGATIDKVTISIEPPPAPNQWQYWLQTTPYGQQLLALLLVIGVGGTYVTTGAPGRAGFSFGGIN